MAKLKIYKFLVILGIIAFTLSNCSDPKIVREQTVSAEIYHSCDSNGDNYKGNDVYGSFVGDRLEILELGGHNEKGDLAINLVGKHTTGDYVMSNTAVTVGLFISQTLLMIKFNTSVSDQVS